MISFASECTLSIPRVGYEDEEEEEDKRTMKERENYRLKNRNYSIHGRHVFFRVVYICHRIKSFSIGWRASKFR